MSKILIVEDHPLTRKGLALLLHAEPDLTVCGEAADAEEALSLLDGLAPDLMTVDLSLPGMSGLDLIREVHRRRPALAVLVVTRHDAVTCAELALRAGARGYIVKQEAGEVIVDAVRHVLAGGLFLSAEMNDQLLRRLAAGMPACEPVPQQVLSRRELEVFELTGRGLGTREIAERLHLSAKTVESYRTRTKAKMHLRSSTELMQHAVRWVEGDASC